MKKPAAKALVEKGLKRPAAKEDPPAKKTKTKQLKRPAAAAELVETQAGGAVETEAGEAVETEAAEAVEAEAGQAVETETVEPDAAAEPSRRRRADAADASKGSSMFPTAAQSYKDSTGNWEAGYFGNNWMVFVTLFVFTICHSLSLSSSLTMSQLGRCLSSCGRKGI